MTTKTTISSGDRRPSYVKAFDKRLKRMSFPNCYGNCPDIEASCPPKDEFERFLSENKSISFNIIPKSWECRLCIYGELL